MGGRNRKINCSGLEPIHVTAKLTIFQRFTSQNEQPLCLHLSVIVICFRDSEHDEQNDGWALCVYTECPRSKGQYSGRS
jgi:hypothetical protein